MIMINLGKTAIAIPVMEEKQWNKIETRISSQNSANRKDFEAILTGHRKRQ